MRADTCGRLVLVSVALAVQVACKGPTTPTPTLAFSVTASPNPMTGGLCTGCGTGSTERESKTTLTIRETGGASGTVTSIAMVLRESGTGTVIAQGEFDAAAVAQLAGSSQLAANGSLLVLCGVHYPPAQQGKAATLIYTVRVTDSRGNVSSHDLAVPVTST